MPWSGIIAALARSTNTFANTPTSVPHPAKGGGTPSQPGPSALAVRVPRSRPARAPSAPSLARSGGRFTCVTACRGACSDLARAVQLSTAHMPSVKPSCAGEVAPSVHKEVGSGVPSASHVRARVPRFRAVSDYCELQSSKLRPSDC
eukprot:1055854-Prymnesium_polylepis.1